MTDTATIARVETIGSLFVTDAGFELTSAFILEDVAIEEDIEPELRKSALLLTARFVKYGMKIYAKVNENRKPRNQRISQILQHNLMTRLKHLV